MKRILYAFFLMLLLLSCNNKKQVIDDTVKVELPKVIEKDTIVLKPKIDTNFLLGKFNYKTDTTFIKADAAFSSKTLYIKKETYTAFEKMHDAAKADGIKLIIISGTRNFNEQKAIWDRKWERDKNLKPLERIKKILEYSSMPSTSRHHWGTDIDLNNLNNSYFKTGKGKNIYDWLKANANDYGFYQVYTDKSGGRTGYNLESWHWSYLPLASKYLEAYNTQITYDDITGFKGSELASEVNMISDYVNGISEKVKNYN